MSKPFVLIGAAVGVLLVVFFWSGVFELVGRLGMGLRATLSWPT